MKSFLACPPELAAFLRGVELALLAIYAILYLLLGGKAIQYLPRGPLAACCWVAFVALWLLCVERPKLRRRQAGPASPQPSGFIEFKLTIKSIS